MSENQDKKPRAQMRRLNATAAEFVAALVEFKTTKAVAQHFNVSEHTVALRRAALRRQSVLIPKEPFQRRVEQLSDQDVEQLNGVLMQHGMATAG